MEGEVVEVQLAGGVCEGLPRELVRPVVVLGVMEGVGGDHVLDFDFHVLDVPGGDARCTEVLDHQFDAGVDVLLVLATGADRSTGAEHEDGQLGVNDAVDDTGELFWFVFAVELNRNVREVEFLGHAGAGDDVDDGQAFFIGGHAPMLRRPVYK